MADVFSAEKRSAVMSRIRSRGNAATELRLIALFRELHIRGWRRNVDVFGRPDFVFPRLRLAVFVDGDFWHGHPTRCRMPTTRPEFWTAKIERNRARDRQVNRELRAKGWRVLRVWEFSLQRKHLSRTKSRLLRAIQDATSAARDVPTPIRPVASVH